MISSEVKTVNICKLQQALELFRISIRGKDSHKELPIQMISTFLSVANNNGITMREAAKEMNVEQSTISRNVKELDVYLEDDKDGNKVKKGCGLLFRAPNEYNRREYSVYLTASGVQLAKAIESVLE